LNRRIGYRFSAYWLRSKCSICSNQFNIDGAQKLASALSRVVLVLQYLQARPTSPSGENSTKI